MKTIFVILVLLVIPLYPFCQVAPSGAGTENDPYLIETLDNLKYISENNSTWVSSKYFKQSYDIDAQQTQTWNDSLGFKPIGNSTNMFKGNYDGQGHKISNLNIKRPGETRCGLFGVTAEAVIENVIIEDANITGLKYVGSLIGYSSKTYIVNCSSSGTIEGLDAWSNSGGIIGVSSGKTHIADCKSTATVIGSKFVGGILGLASKDITIENCYYIGSIKGSNSVGGILGRINLENVSIIANCYSVAEITCPDTLFAGMIIGDNTTDEITSCIYQEVMRFGGVGFDSSISNYTDDSIKALSESEMKLSPSYINAGWDFDTTWFLDDSTINNGYPYLYWQQATSYTLLISDESNSQSLDAPVLNTSLVFSSELPPGTQIMVNEHDSSTTPTNGFLASQHALGSTFWRIKTTYPDTISYTLSFDLQDISTSFDSTNVKILKREDVNSDWEDVIDLGAELSWQDKVVSISGLSSFSDFIPVFDDSSLPVELSSFFANIIDDSSVSVNWEVESETNMLGYYLLKNSNNDFANAEQIPSLIHAINTSQHHSYSVVNHPDTNDIVVFYWLKSVELNSEANYYGPVQVILNDENDQHPIVLAGNNLYPNYPNPFNPSTTISFSVDKPQNADIEIYNVKGQLVKHLLSKYISKPNYKHSIVWNGEDDNHNSVSSGTYFINMKLGDKMFVQKAILMK